MEPLLKNQQYYKFCTYGFLKNLRFFDAFMILFLVEAGLPYTQIGILYASREIFINLFEIPSGIIADTYGRKNALVGSFILYIVSFGVFYLSAGFWPFLCAFMVYGIADAFRSGTHKGMIMDYLTLNGRQGQKIAYYGYTRSWSQKGSALSALIAGLIVFYSASYHTIFLYAIIPYLFNLLLILSYPNNLNHSSTQTTPHSKQGLLLTVKTLFTILRKPRVLKIINTSALHTAFLSSVKDYIQPLMVQVALLLPFMMHNKPEQKNGIVIGVIYFFIYLGTSRASQLASSVAAKNKKTISYTTLLTGFLLGAISGLFFILSLWVLSIVAFIGIFMIENIRKPILAGFVADNVPNSLLTSVISAQSLLKTIITASLAFIFGLLADHSNIGVAFISVSLVLIIATVGINIRGRKTG